MDKVDYPVKAVFIPGQRGTEILLDPLNNKMTKKSNENWNAVSKITLPMKPSIWSVLRSIQLEEQHSKARYHENLGARSEEEDSRKRTTDRLTKFKKLRAIVQSYGEIPIDDYITALISLFNEVGSE